MAAHQLVKLHVVCQWRFTEISVLLFSLLGEFQRTFNVWIFLCQEENEMLASSSLLPVCGLEGSAAPLFCG